MTVANLTELKKQRDQGQICSSWTMQVKDLLKELIHDGIDNHLLDGLIERYN